MVPIFRSCFSAMLVSSNRRAMLPSSFNISHMTATSLSPASRARSVAASVCPALLKTPPGFARSGKIWPGCTRSSPMVASSARSLMVSALSEALMPVVIPLAASTETVKFVLNDSRLLGTIMGNSSRMATDSVMGEQIKPRPYFVIKLTISGVMH